jgi:hypothetical protein
MSLWGELPTNNAFISLDPVGEIQGDVPTCASGVGGLVPAIKVSSFHMAAQTVEASANGFLTIQSH